MFYNKNDVNVWVRKADKRMDVLTDEEIDEKIDLLYSLGYVYNPYYQEFRNHFIDRGFKAIAIYNLIPDEIIQMHENFKSETIKRYGREQNFEEVLERLDKLSPRKSFKSIKLLSAPIGVLLLLLSPIFQYYESYILCLLTALTANVLINHFISKSATIATVQGKWGTSMLWQKFDGIFYILGLCSLAYCYYVLYLATESFWIPVLILLLIRYLYRRYVAIQVAREYRAFHEYLQVRDYVEL